MNFLQQKKLELIQDAHLLTEKYFYCICLDSSLFRVSMEAKEEKFNLGKIKQALRYNAKQLISTFPKEQKLNSSTHTPKKKEVCGNFQNKLGPSFSNAACSHCFLLQAAPPASSTLPQVRK